MCVQELPVLTLNEQFSDTNIYFAEVHNVFTVQKLLTCRSHGSTA